MPPHLQLSVPVLLHTSHQFINPIFIPFLLLSLASSFFTFAVISELPSMASVSATSLKLFSCTTQGSWRGSSLRPVSVRWAKTSFPSLRTSRFRISCSAKPETFDKVCEIVRKQLALPPESELTPETKFSALGADSLDTVEIVMGLEEEFDISVEEESSENITTVQEAADLIEKLVQKKAS